MRRKGFIILLLALSLNVFGQKAKEWIRFVWQGETIFGKYYPKVAMSVPLKIENLPYSFCGQLDLGATTTMIYENSFKAFSKEAPFVLQKLDTTLGPYYMNGRKCYFLKNLSFSLDKTLFSGRNLALVPDYGEEIPADSIHTPTQKLIGTIAPDLFQSKFLVIDFRQNRMAAFDALPKKYQSARFVTSIIRKGRIKVPVVIGDSTWYVMFDTGNCLTDLLLDKQTIQAVSNPGEEAQETLNGNTWGQSVVYYSKKMKYKPRLNGMTLNIQQALFSDLDSDVQFNKEEKIIGLIGPVTFANKTVIIDYKNSRFGIL